MQYLVICWWKFFISIFSQNYAGKMWCYCRL